MALCTVCARKGVINLLNHTSLTGRLVAAQNKYGGYRNKTRSTVDPGGLLIQSEYSHLSPWHHHVRVTRAHRHIIIPWWYPTGSPPDMSQHASLIILVITRNSISLSLYSWQFPSVALSNSTWQTWQVKVIKFIQHHALRIMQYSIWLCMQE